MCLLLDFQSERVDVIYRKCCREEVSRIPRAGLPGGGPGLGCDPACLWTGTDLRGDRRSEENRRSEVTAKLKQEMKDEQDVFK